MANKDKFALVEKFSKTHTGLPGCLNPKWKPRERFLIEYSSEDYPTIKDLIKALSEEYSSYLKRVWPNSRVSIKVADSSGGVFTSAKEQLNIEKIETIVIYEERWI